MAQRAGMGTRTVAAVHWGFTAFQAGLALVFLRLPPNWKPLIVLPALAVQLAWLAVVAWRVRRAGLSWRG
jgi:UDP-GlcNAc:undecaprenyl-phosphate GlcNAc-1-phosphate transferase